MIMWRGGETGLGRGCVAEDWGVVQDAGPPAGEYLDVPSRSDGYHVREGSYLATGCYYPT